jgi:ATP dependent DNA ligase C terminal region
MRPTRPVTGVCGGRSNASTAPNLSWSAGPIPKGGGPIAEPCCSVIFDPDGRLIYAGRAGTGIDNAELERLWRRLQPLATLTPPRSTRFGSPLVLSRVHWVRPELVAEVKFLTWTEDNLLRQVVYKGLREDKPARGAAGGAEARRVIFLSGICGKISRHGARSAEPVAAHAGNNRQCRLKIDDDCLRLTFGRLPPPAGIFPRAA